MVPTGQRLTGEDDVTEQEDDAWRRELRRRRADNRRSLRSLGVAVDADYTYLSKIENGHDRPSRDLVVRLDAALNAGGDIVALFDGLPCSRCGRRAEATAAAEQRLDVERLRKAHLNLFQESGKGLFGGYIDALISEYVRLTLLDAPPPASPRQGEPES